MVILSPIWIIIAFLVKTTSKGPIIYNQKRVGRDEKVFICHKFRSMEEKNSRNASKWTTKDDPRITPLGNILRKTNLDELPQLWDIFCGKMSFVGPRPEQPFFVEKFEEEIPDYFRRHKVKAGLTGWAQVNGLKGDTSIKERVRYDIFYIENWSLWFDFKIVIKTLGILIYETVAGKYEYRSRT
jgi:lipopolysaccharide/colanic/teichoic acid biosynthesis glycosyltransferase